MDEKSGKPDVIRVATHNGTFHADEVFALAALRLCCGPDGLEIIRTRDTELMNSCDLRVDVGMGYDPATGDFDHHQPGGAGTRCNGILYASFGLIWRDYGSDLCGGLNDAAADVDRNLVQTIDAHDNGQNVWASPPGAPPAATVERFISVMNPSWETEPTDTDYERAFFDALDVAQAHLAGEIKRAVSQQHAAAFVRYAIESADDDRVLILERYLPWDETVVTEAPLAQFVIFPASTAGQWGVQAVPREIGVFSSRVELPEAWAGLTDDELAGETGVPDAVFCHSARFYAAARSREGALRLAALATR